MFTNQIDGNIRIQFAEAKHFFSHTTGNLLQIQISGTFVQERGSFTKESFEPGENRGWCTCDCDRLVSVIT